MRNEPDFFAITTMTKYFSRTLLLLAGCAVCATLTGCALTRTETAVTFAPKVNEPLKAERKSSLTVGEIKDSRPVHDGNVIIHKQNEYGTASGAYVTKPAGAEILKNGLADAFKQNGFTGADAAKYELQGDIQEFTFEGIGGFWQATVKPKFVVRFELVEKGSGRPVWHDTYNGRTTGKTAWGDNKFVEQMFTESADDLVKQLVSDKSFREFFE